MPLVSSKKAWFSDFSFHLNVRNSHDDLDDDDCGDDCDDDNDDDEDVNEDDEFTESP